MATVTHYDVLGVTRSADDATIRRAYLELARVLHPDADGGDADAMVVLNEAWAVLGDPETRARYDAGLVNASRSFANRPATTAFVPYDDSDDEGADDWLYEPDEGDPRTAPHRRVLLAPVVCLALAVLVTGVWLVSPIDELVVVAVLLVAGSLVGFLVAPIVAMAKASQYERRPLVDEDG
jgi:hypothetical protein